MENTQSIDRNANLKTLELSPEIQHKLFMISKVTVQSLFKIPPPSEGFESFAFTVTMELEKPELLALKQRLAERGITVLYP